MTRPTCFAEGIRAYRAGQYARAIRALRPLAERKDLPGRLARHYSALSHRALGLEHLAGRRFAAAAEHFRGAMDLVGQRADLAEYLLASYAATGEHERCAIAGEALVESRPAAVAPRVYLAQAQWRSGHRAAAYMTLTQALRRLGDHAELHLNLGVLYAAEEKYEPARHHLAQAIECDSTCARAHRYLGLVEVARGQHGDAARALQRAWALDPGDLLVAYQLSLAAAAAAGAGRSVTVALPGRPRPPADSQIRQLAEYAAGDPAFVQAFLDLPPSQADEELLGVLLAVLRTALSAHPGYADLHYYTAVALRRAGDAASARNHLRRALRINPDYARALLELGALCASTGDRQRAVAYLRRAVGAGADWPDVHLRLGDLLAADGQVDSARGHYEKALGLNGRYAPAAERLASLAA